MKTNLPKVFIVHGCPSNKEKAMNPETRTYDKHWMPWLRKQLADHDIESFLPLMPDPWEPNYDKFKGEFDKYTVSENDILIGHSCGTTFFLRWLEDTKQKVAKLILVAPWKIADKNDLARKEYYEYPIDPTIKDRVGEIIYFTADDEDEDGKKSLSIIHDILAGRIIELKGKGHYTLADMRTEEFPELLKEIVG